MHLAARYLLPEMQGAKLSDDMREQAAYLLTSAKIASTIELFDHDQVIMAIATLQRSAARAAAAASALRCTPNRDPRSTNRRLPTAAPSSPG
jgi:hypothetical protein